MKSFNKSLVRTAAVLLFGACALTCCSSAPVKASADSDYETGIQAFEAKDYKTASDYFQKAANVGMSSTKLWTLLAQSYENNGDRLHAIDSYTSLVSNFRDTPEAAAALKKIAKLNPEAAKLAAIKIPMPEDVVKLPFKDRILIVPGRLGHPQVSDSMRAAADAAIAHLPPHIYKILDEGGATVSLLPNITDKWPGCGEDPKPGDPGETMGDIPGTCYGRDIHIYEREKLKGSDELGEPRSTSEITHHLNYEFGHAIDDCLGIYTANDTNFKIAFALDLAAMPSKMRDTAAYYYIPMEGCAEVFAELIENDPEGSRLSIICFPNTRAYLKEKLKL